MRKIDLKRECSIMKKYEVWFTFSVELELENPDDEAAIARAAKPHLIDRITSDSIASCIEDVVEIE